LLLIAAGNLSSIFAILVGAYLLCQAFGIIPSKKKAKIQKYRKILIILGLVFIVLGIFELLR